MRDRPSRSRRRTRPIGAVGALLFALALAACTIGGGATPAPGIAPGTIAGGGPTAGLPAPPPTATLPPTPPTAAATRPGTPGIFGPATLAATANAATASRATTPGAGRRQTATAAPLIPVGERPAGWFVYTGSLPFNLAYPPDWVPVEDAAHGILYLYSPDPARTTFLVLAAGVPETDPNLDILRDRWFRARVARCARFAVDTTGQERHSDLDFATVGATCDLPGGLAYSLTGIALRGDTPWIFELDAPYADYAALRDAAFAPILATWQIGR